jgi:DNA-binding transcriptional MerR regulator
MEPRNDACTETSYAIGDVAKICNVPAYTIRFWEKEFNGFIEPVRTSGKQRRYRESHIHKIMRIKKLLYGDRFSIQGAKRMLGITNIIPFPESQDTVQIPDPQELAMSIAHFIQDQLTKPHCASHEHTASAVL